MDIEGMIYELSRLREQHGNLPVVGHDEGVRKDFRQVTVGLDAEEDDSVTECVLYLKEF